MFPAAHAKTTIRLTISYLVPRDAIQCPPLLVALICHLFATGE